MKFVFEELNHKNFEYAKKIDRTDVPISFVDSIDTIMQNTDYGVEHNLIGHTFLVSLEGEYIAYLLLGEALRWDTDPEEMKKESFYRLMGFVVDKKYRNKGYGGEILEQAIEIVYKDFGIRSIALGCHKDNIKAATFYKKHQFRPTGKFEGNDEYYLRLQKDKNVCMDILEKVQNNEKNHTMLTSTKEIISNNIIRYSDELLPDMYDNNCFEISSEITDKDYALMLEIKNNKKEKHFKIMSKKSSKFLLEKGMEEDVILTMLKENPIYLNKCKRELIFKNIKESNIKPDLVKLECKHFGEIYGTDFTLRKCNRFYDIASNNDNNLNYFAAYIDDVIVASCSAFYYDGVVCLDDLITDIDYRHQGIATALISYVHNKFNCPLFLHADNDDTPKNMYRDLGFEIINSSFEYFSCDE